MDLFLTGWGCQGPYPAASLLINDGSGSFIDETSGRLPSAGFIFAAAAAPLDDNPSIDLVVVDWLATDTSDYQFFHPAIWLNNGTGVFSRDTANRFQESGYGYFRPDVFDVNNDTLIDILFSNQEMYVVGPGGPDPIDTLSGRTAVYLNTGGGFFQDKTLEWIPAPDSGDLRQVTHADIDLDGDQDLLEVGWLFGTYTPQCRVLVNDSAKRFLSVESAVFDTLTGWFNEVNFGMLNNDSYPDLFFARVEPGVPDYDVLLLNNLDGTFSDSSTLLPSVRDFSVSASLFDHQKDDDLDIVIGNGDSLAGSPGQNVLYHNTLNELVGVGDDPGNPAGDYQLLQNYPNPFNPVTRIEWYIPERSFVRLVVYDIFGRQVKTLVEGTYEPGRYSINADFAGLASGVYTYRISAGEYIESKKLVVLK